MLALLVHGRTTVFRAGLPQHADDAERDIRRGRRFTHAALMIGQCKNAGHDSEFLRK